MATYRLQLRQDGDDATSDTVLLSTRPVAGSVPLRATDGLGVLSLDAVFADNALADGAADTALAHAGVTSGRFLVPSGWVAEIHMLTMYTVGDGDDITAITGNFYLGGTDIHESFGALTLNPAEDSSTSAVPVSAPYTITGENTFDMRATTNGTGGTMGVVIHVLGHLYRI